MTLRDLLTRVVETTGMDVVTVESLSTAVSNCYADLTSRGYRLFKEHIYNENEIDNGEDIARVKLIKKVRKSLYFRIQFANGIATARRVSLTNPAIQASVTSHGFRTNISLRDVIYYVKGDEIVIEWHKSVYGNIKKIFYGYYERLSAPTLAIDEKDLDNTTIDIREEFEDVVVMYCVYFYYQREGESESKVNQSMNNYKYLVEDLLHELAFEDTYNEGDLIVGEE